MYFFISLSLSCCSRVRENCIARAPHPRRALALPFVPPPLLPPPPLHCTGRGSRFFSPEPVTAALASTFSRNSPFCREQLQTRAVRLEEEEDESTHGGAPVQYSSGVAATAPPTRGGWPGGRKIFFRTNTRSGLSVSLAVSVSRTSERESEPRCRSTLTLRLLLRGAARFCKCFV